MYSVAMKDRATPIMYWQQRISWLTEGSTGTADG